MTSIKQLDVTTQQDILKRLKRIEGQARGIQRMVEDGRACQDIMQQTAALRAAAHALSIQIVENYALHCLRESGDAQSLEQAVTQVVSVVSKLTR